MRNWFKIGSAGFFEFSSMIIFLFYFLSAYEYIESLFEKWNKLGLFMSKQYKLIYQTHQYTGQIINYHLTVGSNKTMTLTARVHPLVLN